VSFLNSKSLLMECNNVQTSFGAETSHMRCWRTTVSCSQPRRTYSINQTSPPHLSLSLPLSDFLSLSLSLSLSRLHTHCPTAARGDSARQSTHWDAQSLMVGQCQIETAKPRGRHHPAPLGLSVYRFTLCPELTLSLALFQLSMPYPPSGMTSSLSSAFWSEWVVLMQAVDPDMQAELIRSKAQQLEVAAICCPRVGLRRGRVQG